jgi:hypothetical protein
MSDEPRETPRFRIPKLNSVARVGAQIGTIYRAARLKKLDTIEAYRLTQILLGLKACLESAEIEKRLEQVEQALSARERPASPPLRLIPHD